ncbi:MAG: hypothetical protein ABSB26_02415 [Nitrososphaerales archaeon]|jgi:hypothetical protein
MKATSWAIPSWKRVVDVWTITSVANLSAQLLTLIGVSFLGFSEMNPVTAAYFQTNSLDLLILRNLFTMVFLLCEFYLMRELFVIVSSGLSSASRGFLYLLFVVSIIVPMTMTSSDLIHDTIVVVTKFI